MSESPLKCRAKIYVLEDDQWYAQFLHYHLSLNPDHDVVVFTTAEDFIKGLAAQPDVVTLDYHLPDYSGEAILNKILEVSPNTYTLVISGQEDISKAVNMIKQGAYDYIVKNHETKDRLWTTIEKIKHNIALKQEIEELRNAVKQKYTLGTELIGNSDAMQSVFKLVEKAAHSSINVTTSGEAGTGKELIAKAIHQYSSRSKKPFVAVNISAIPNELLESELFGHEKGAFTGAANLRIGKFEEANGGTIFLDGIGEMSINLQAKLLRVLQEREVSRVGSNAPIPIDVRILTATHRNLMEEVLAGNFREDLYYRLLGINVHLPPLRERGHDILLIAHKFLEDFYKQNDIAPKRFSAEAQKKLLGHLYPGNVRELKAIVELAAVLCDKDQIAAEDIQLQETKTGNFSYDKTLDEYIADTVQKYLDKYNYNVISVADKLKIGESTIYRMIRKKEVVINNQLSN